PEVIARAQAGDTLKLASGTYKTKLLIDKPITIEGQPTAPPQTPPTPPPPEGSIPEVIARAQAGDTLKLASGTYKTKLLIDKPITI
ncbi:hypothetical protein GR255_28445, partial [Mycobacterium tuberculosis]|nr:hypothetical protein [Mycobacterium tuberculosis]